MTGLENIIAVIRQDAEKAASETIAEAQGKADELLAEAHKTGGFKADDILKRGDIAANDVIERAKSAAQLETRRTLLGEKQSIIRNAIEEAKETLAALEPNAYFDVLVRLVGRFSLEDEGEMRLSEKDLSVMPADFEDRVRAAAKGKLQINRTPAAIKNGFLLVYGGIDINCTFDALFEAAAEELQDKAGNILFE